MNHKITCLFTIALLLNACNSNTEQIESDHHNSPIIATTGTHTFYESDLDIEVKSLPESLQHLKNDPIVRSQVLKGMIRRSVLSQHALELGLDRDPVIQERLQHARDSLLIEALQNWQVSRVPTPTQEEISQYFKQHQHAFTTPEHIHARHILVRTQKEARELLKTLKKNRGQKNKFETLAAEFSIDDSNKSLGGNLNWFPRGVMVKSFEKAAFALKKAGNLSQPIKTEFGWHIIELLGKRPASHKSLDEARDEIVSILQHQEMERWVDQLIDKADVSINKSEYQLPESP